MNFEHASPIELLIGPGSIFAFLVGLFFSFLGLTDKARARNFIFSFFMGLTALFVGWLLAARMGHGGPTPAAYRTIPVTYDSYLGMCIALIFAIAFALDAVIARAKGRVIENVVLTGIYSVAAWGLIRNWPRP